MKWFEDDWPKAWRLRSLKRVARLRYGDSLAVADREEGRVPVYGSNGIVGMHNVANQTAPGIILGRKGSHGKVVFASEPAFVIDTAYGISARETRNDLRWLFYALTSSTIDEKMRDSPVPGLASRDAYLIDVPYPPPPEQKLIAAYLDASCVAIDRAMEAKQKQLETLDTLRKSIITPAVLSGLDSDRLFHETGNPWLSRIPKGWRLVALKRISETQSGITLGKTYEPPLVQRPYLRAANVQDGYLDLEKITSIELPASLLGRYELQTGDVLMTEGGDLDKLGRGFLWDGQIPGCLHQNHVFAIRTNPRFLLPQFLAYLTASRYGRDYFEATGKRTTNLASTNSTKVGLFPIPIPSIPEQKVIVEHIDQKLKQAGSVEESISAQIQTLVNYRKSLIHECVTGKRRISDADVARVESHV